MKTADEISDLQEKIKIQLTRESDEKAVAFLQGQYASLEWVLDKEEKE